MALYSYQCKCGLRFTKSARMADYRKPAKCPECGKDAPRHIPDDIDGVFQFESTGPVPQNTGVQDIDAIADRAIGQSAKQGWDVIKKRVREKRQLLNQNPDVDPRSLSRNPDGSYRVLRPEEREIHDRAMAINKLAMKRLLQRKEKAPKTFSDDDK